jgi:hypothetical protein
LTILWGTIDANNEVEFFAQNGDPLGIINGADLAMAAAAYDPGYVWANGVDITVEVKPPYYSLQTIGGPNLTFEYSNLVSVVPEPPTFVLLGVGAIGLLGYAWRRRRLRTRLALPHPTTTKITIKTLVFSLPLARSGQTSRPAALA